MGQNPSRIDRQIVANREQIAATLDAIAYNLDIPARLSERSNAILTSAVDLADNVSGKLSDASLATARALPGSASGRLGQVVPLAIAYFIGMLIGLSWPKANL